MSIGTTLNFAQKTNFICGCSLFSDLEFYLQSATLPSITFSLSDVKSLNLTHHVASTDHSYGSVSFDILIDEDFKVYDLFFNEFLNAKSLTNPTYAQREFTTWIQVFNNKGKLLFTEYFYNCMLSSIGDCSLSAVDSAVTNTLSVSFVFDWLEIKHESPLKIQKPQECNCNCKS